MSKEYPHTFKIKDKVRIHKVHAHITELPDDQIFTIYRIDKEVEKIKGEKDEIDIYYQLETPLGVKFSANNFELEKITKPKNKNK